MKGIADNESRNQNDYKERRNTNKSTKQQETSERQIKSAEFAQSKKGRGFSASRLKAEFMNF